MIAGYSIRTSFWWRRLLVLIVRWFITGALAVLHSAFLAVQPVVANWMTTMLTHAHEPNAASFLLQGL